MTSAEYMPLGRQGGPYRPHNGLSPLRLAMLVGVGLVVAWFVRASSSPTVVPSDPEAEARMRAAQAFTSGRVVHSIEDRGEGDDVALRDNPKALFALRQALREAVAEAKAVSSTTDPLEILAHKLLARRGGSGSGASAGSGRGGHDDEDAGVQPGPPSLYHPLPLPSCPSTTPLLYYPRLSPPPVQVL